ncbi:MAG: response regulator [Nitratireductor sp.]
MTKSTKQNSTTKDLSCEVYLVDDDHAMVNTTVQWLTLSGLKVRAFSEPLALFRAIKPEKPIVIISDIRMPDMDGLELLFKVKAKNNSIPVILITGHGDVELAVEAMKAGAYEFLTKPFSPERLLESVQSAIKIVQEDIREKQNIEVIAKDTFIQKMKEERARLEQTDFTPNAQMQDSENDTSEDLNSRISQYEQTLISQSLLKHKGNIAAVLEELNLPRRTLNQKMKKYNLVSKAFKTH